MLIKAIECSKYFFFDRLIPEILKINIRTEIMDSAILAKIGKTSTTFIQVLVASSCIGMRNIT